MIEKIKDGVYFEERNNGNSRLRYGEFILPHKPSMVLKALLEVDGDIESHELIKKVYGDKYYGDFYGRQALRVYLTQARQFLKKVDSELEIVRTDNYKIKIE